MKNTRFVGSKKDIPTNGGEEEEDESPPFGAMVGGAEPITSPSPDDEEDALHSGVCKGGTG